MRQIVTTMLSVILMITATFIVFGVVQANADYAKARNYEANATDMIEDSNCSPSVISQVESDAKSAGYDLTVTSTTVDSANDDTMATIVLSYKYQIPVLGISKTKEFRSIAQ